ncbi:MAG TPA: cytidylate kinase-like family protein [Ktedonobacteraceae bacterium]|jgi:cytidylate kinase|nr:cytidylate kinase-like family protein [Ktedonobacteraceae bacterium]
MGHLFRGRARAKPGTPAQKATKVLPETLWSVDPLPTGNPPEGSVVVTISRQFGSGGAEIGRLVAEASNLQYIDHQIIHEVAERLGVDTHHVEQQDEQSSDMVGHVLQAMRLSNPFSVNYTNLFNDITAREFTQEAAYLHFTQKVILEIASRGNAVIVGRGSQFLLHNAPRTLHISIYCPLSYRIENVMDQLQIGRDEARLMIERRDYEQDSYLRRYYGRDGHRPELYHLLINTGLFPHKLAAELICQSLYVIKAIGN